MKEEINKGINFLKEMLQKNTNISKNTVLEFCRKLEELLFTSYTNNWHPELPNKGEGYRCLRINDTMDPVVKRAATDSGLSEELLRQSFPKELTLWIDPHTVCYRIGEDHGSISVLWSRPANTNISESDSISTLSNSVESLSLGSSGYESDGSSPKPSSPPPKSSLPKQTCNSKTMQKSGYEFVPRSPLKAQRFEMHKPESCITPPTQIYQRLSTCKAELQFSNFSYDRSHYSFSEYVAG